MSNFTAYIFLNGEFDQNFACEGLADAIAKIQKICPAAEFTQSSSTSADGHDKAAGHKFLILLHYAD